MTILYVFLVLYLASLSMANHEPAVRLRITQKGLDYAMKNAMDIAVKKLENQSLPNVSKNVAFLFLSVAFKNMKIYGVNISSSSLLPFPDGGMHARLNKIRFNVKGMWNMALGKIEIDSGTFDVAVKDLSITLLTDIEVNSGRLTVGNITCVSTLDGVDTKFGQKNSFPSMFQSTINKFIRKKIPEITCSEGKKSITQELNDLLLKFPIKTTDPKNLVTLDYSVVKALDYNVDSVDIFLKGEFSTSNGSNSWLHQPASLPFDGSRDRMVYVTIMDDMINSASHAYFNQGMMSFQTSKSHLKSRAAISVGTNLTIQFSARSPPHIIISSSGLHFNLRLKSKITAVLPLNVIKHIYVLTNVSATAVLRLSGAKLNTKISDLKIVSRVMKISSLSTFLGKENKIKNIVKNEIETLIADATSEIELPLPLSETFQLIKPKITYGKGFVTLETDILYKGP
ncbi:bactericidal permeability-increasing protein-like [Xenia sp. Carnegie-2017]|uniref:bactericidal permeability-increasing protein-like n=1 Tax=Xenia sp. Carnegie-2017 TaxID=2897299 RepID=UPI001F03B4E4|nr:bactericidal permeability-increasing protein-like [Xenia sp. Carnegie-2017]